MVDFAAMRDAVKRLGGDPGKINPVSPVDLVIDHSVQVDVFRRWDLVYCKVSIVCWHPVWLLYKDANLFTSLANESSLDTYRIMGKFGGSFNLVIWRIWPLIAKLKFPGGRKVSAVVATPETPVNLPNGSFAKCNTRQIFPLYGIIMCFLVNQ